jgi:hypothetical protein
MNRVGDLMTAATPNGTPEELAPPLPGGGRRLSKTEQYGWKLLDDPGEFRQLHKSLLNVDHEYQRTKIHNSRVLAIASAWSWAALGVLVVAVRPDGTFWVLDGQHRKLAADKRADVQHLPCMVFRSESKVKEAFAFLLSTTHRGPVRAIDKFNALVMSQNPVAVAVKELVESSGYRVHPSGPKTVECVGTLMSAVKLNPDAAGRAWRLAVELFDGAEVTNSIFESLFQLEHHLGKKEAGSLTTANNRQALLRLGVPALMRSIQEAMAYHGGGAKSGAEGIARVLNKGRRTHRLPTPHGAAADDDAN